MTPRLTHPAASDPPYVSRYSQGQFDVHVLSYETPFRITTNDSIPTLIGLQLIRLRECVNPNF